MGLPSTPSRCSEQKRHTLWMLQHQFLSHLALPLRPCFVLLAIQTFSLAMIGQTFCHASSDENCNTNSPARWTPLGSGGAQLAVVSAAVRSTSLLRLCCSTFDFLGASSSVRSLKTQRFSPRFLQHALQPTTMPGGKSTKILGMWSRRFFRIVTARAWGLIQVAHTARRLHWAMSHRRRCAQRAPFYRACARKSPQPSSL